MELIYQDNSIVVCVKPARVLSTDEPGGVPELVRQELGDPKADVRTVHRKLPGHFVPAPSDRTRPDPADAQFSHPP